MSPVSLQINDGVASIRFNRPERLNALDLDMTRAFRDAVRQALGDASVRVVRLSGEGRAFVAGGDLGFLRKAGDRRAAARDLIRPIHDAIADLHESGLPAIACVQGPVAGAGVSLMLMADFVLATPDTTLTMAYIKVAATPDCGGSWFLARLVGLRKATEIALLSDQISADDALNLGLVTRVVPTDRIEAEALALSARLAAAPAVALATTKSLLTAAQGGSLREHLEREIEAFAACAAGEEFEEGVSAFFERRIPDFQRVAG